MIFLFGRDRRDRAVHLGSGRIHGRIHGGWGLLAWFGAVAPPSPKGGWWNGALVALGILAGARDFSSHLEAQEKSTGVSGFWGPYRREAAIGAFTGAAGLWLLVR